MRQESLALKTKNDNYNKTHRVADIVVNYTIPISSLSFFPLVILDYN